jgi:hypothetical protein
MDKRYQALAMAQWPQADRETWFAACRPDERLTPGGAASGMNHRSQKTCTRCYGYLLDFCRRTGRLVHDAAPAALVVPETMDAFLMELQTRVGSVTRYTYIGRIRRVAEILDPAGNFRWLRLIERELKDQARPRSRAHRVVDSRRLWRLGLDLLERAEKAAEMTNLRRARLYRDGLMVGLLSVCTVRLGNYAFLEVDRHLRKINGEWWMLFSAEETKSRRPDERPVPAALTAAIDRWLSHWRGYFKNPSSAFWVSTKGGQSGLHLRGNHNHRSDAPGARSSRQPAFVPPFGCAHGCHSQGRSNGHRFRSASTY